MQDRKPLIVLVLGACAIAFAAVFVRLSTTGPAAAGVWRLGFALPFLFMLTAWERRSGLARGPGFLGASPKVMGLCGAMFAADLVCWHYSLQYTSVANSTVLANMTPVLVTALAWLLFKERPAPVFLAGLGLAIAGAATMALARGAGGQGSDPMLGDGLALVTTVWYALYFLTVREARKTASAVQVMLGSSLAGLPLVLAAAMLLREPILPATALGWAACIGLGVVHVTGQGAIAWALGKVPTALAAVVILVQPVAAALLSWMIFSEAVTPVQALGAGVALGGVALAQLSSRRRPPPVAGEAEALAGQA